jgi:hypothetical protein
MFLTRRREKREQDNFLDKLEIWNLKFSWGSKWIPRYFIAGVVSEDVTLERGVIRRGSNSVGLLIIEEYLKVGLVIGKVRRN